MILFSSFCDQNVPEHAVIFLLPPQQLLPGSGRRLLFSRSHTLKTEPHTPAQSAVSLLFSSVEPGGRNVKATIACSLAYLDWVPLAKSLKGGESVSL